MGKYSAVPSGAAPRVARPCMHETSDHASRFIAPKCMKRMYIGAYRAHACATWGAYTLLPEGVQEGEGEAWSAWSAPTWTGWRGPAAMGQAFGFTRPDRQSAAPGTVHAVRPSHVPRPSASHVSMPGRVLSALYIGARYTAPSMRD